MQDQTIPKKDRGLISHDRYFEEAFKRLEDAIGHISEAFDPVIAPSKPEAINCENEKDSVSPAEYTSKMVSYVRKINGYADRIHSICNRSEI
jgi:hypothetical protein